MPAMGTKSREVIWGGQIMNAKILARRAREAAQKAAREADRAEAYAVVSPDGRLRRARAAIANDRAMSERGSGLARGRVQQVQDQGELAIRRPRDTPIWKLEAALKCRSCRKDRYAPPVHMIKLTETQEITPYKWVHPDEEQ